MTPDDVRSSLRVAVDAVAAALHAYVDVAAGVAAEADSPKDAQADPRLAEARHRAGLALGRLDDELLLRLGLDEQIGVAWDGVESPLEELPADAEPEDELPGDDFFLHFVVCAAPGASAESLDRAIEVVDEAGFEVLNRLEEAGFVVPSFGASRGLPIVLDADEDADEDDLLDDDDGDGHR